MTPTLKGWPTKAKEAPSPHEVRLALLDMNPVFYFPGDKVATGHLCDCAPISELLSLPNRLNSN